MTVPMVLHVIPTAVARGAQREARALRDGLDEPGVRHHRLLCLFAGPEEVPVDESLDHRARGVVAQGIDVTLVVRLRRLLHRENPAVVVAHGGDPLKYLVAATVGTRRPIAYYATGTFGAAGHPMRVALWRGLVARAAVVACEGREVMSECRQLLHVPPERLVLAPNGRDPAVFHPREAVHDDEGDPVLAFVGAFTEGKGPDRFVATVAELRRRGVALRAVAYGDGPLRRDLEPGAADAGVELAGTVDDVASAMRRSDVLVFPSRPTGEGMPGVLIEAGLSGLPVVACRGPGVDWIVEDGETGILVSVGDGHALVDASAQLLEEPARRRAMGEAARRRCVEHFGIDTVLSVWASFLVPLVAGRS